jgi:hypothetical protein
MQLVADWKLILKKAWSIRLMLLASLLSGAEVILPQFTDVVPPNLFAALSFVVVGGAFAARLVAQPKMRGDTP